MARGEAKVVARAAVDVRSTAPVGRDAGAEAIVEIAALRFDLVARTPAGRADGVAMEIVELRHALPDRDLVDEIDGVRQRE